MPTWPTATFFIAIHEISASPLEMPFRANVRMYGANRISFFPWMPKNQINVKPRHLPAFAECPGIFSN
jgi:hypothetical protein